MPEDFSGDFPGWSQSDSGESGESSEGNSWADMNPGGAERRGGRAPSSTGSFSGMPGQSSTQTDLKNLITYGVCLVIAVAALFLIKGFKRRRY